MQLAHVGIVVEDIRPFAAMLQGILQAEPLTEIVDDPHNQARLQMFRTGDGYLELIAPLDKESGIRTILSHGGERLLHLCFECDDLESELARMKGQGMLVFRSPAPAPLFGGKRVAFGLLPNRMMVEFVEKGWQEAMQRIGPKD